MWSQTNVVSNIGKSDNTPTKPNSTLTSYQMQRPKTNLKTQGIQLSERHTCSGHNAQTNDYFTTGYNFEILPKVLCSQPLLKDSSSLQFL